MKTSISDTDNYRTKCRIFSEDDTSFDQFKIDPIYTGILEHTTKTQALGYIDFIKKSKLDFSKIPLLKSNDEQGSPILENYGDEVFDNISPSSIRYIKVLSELINIYTHLNGINIVEIGVGYGGQCKMINDYFSVKSYQLIDLPEVLMLAERYLRKYEYTNLKFGGDFSEKYDFVISNYAITECSKDVQCNYIDNIINNSRHGYITCNFISDQFNIDSLSKEEFINRIKHSVNTMDEYPLTYNNNIILYW